MQEKVRVQALFLGYAWIDKRYKLMSVCLLEVPVVVCGVSESDVSIAEYFLESRSGQVLVEVYCVELCQKFWEI